MNASTTRPAPVTARRRASARPIVTTAAVVATATGGERMTIAQRRAHTMMAIKAGSATVSSSPSIPPPRASPRSAAPTRRASAAPRAPVEPARVPTQAPEMDQPQVQASETAAPVPIEAEVSAPAPIETQASVSVQASDPDQVQRTPDADKISRLEAMVVALQLQVETLASAQAASKCECRHQLSVVADSVVTLENTVFGVHDKLLRLEEHVLAKMECWEDRVKAQMAAFHADMQSLADSLAALKEPKTNRTSQFPSKLRKPGQPCRARVFGAYDSFRSSSYTSVASGSSYSSAASSHTSAASSSFASMEQDFAAVANTSDAFQDSHASMASLSRSAIELLLAREFSEDEANQENAWCSAVADASDAFSNDLQSSSDDAGMAPMLCLSDLC